MNQGTESEFEETTIERFSGPEGVATEQRNKHFQPVIAQAEAMFADWPQAA